MWDNFRMLRWPHAKVVLSSLLLVSCSLQAPRPTVLVRANFKNTRAGSTYAAMKSCLFLTAKSAQGQESYSRATFNGLDPIFVGVDGTVFGPYTEDMLSAGVALTVPIAQTRFRIFGVDGPGCEAKKLDENFVRGNLAGLYLLGETDADLTTVSTASLTATLEAGAPNRIGLSTRTYAADTNLYLPVSRIYRGYSGTLATTAVAFDVGLGNYGTTFPVEIPFSNFLNVLKPIPVSEMGGQQLHERYDILISVGERTLDSINQTYGALKIDIEATTTFHAVTSGCAPSPTSSPSYLFEAGYYVGGGWQGVRSSIQNGAGSSDGMINWILDVPGGPDFWRTYFQGGVTDDPASMRISLRASNFASPATCTAFTIKSFDAYFKL